MLSLRRIILFTAAMLLFTGILWQGGIVSGASTHSGPDIYLPLVVRAPSPPPSVPTFEDRVIQLTNQERAKAGLAPLTRSAELSRAAQEHSVDMATGNFVSHIGSDGSNPGDRITRAGYAWYTFGENVAAGYTTPESVVEGWMQSEGHRQNILNPDFKHIGVGHAHNASSDYKHYWTQVFGAR
ncbi:MAG TPA: CAP domain-containing protein [Chloroflexi bacterium]|jgi:uncharacterized protein YkwD|nr:CAP domain-containing protein [Chloroflexota bacterium]